MARLTARIKHLLFVLETIVGIAAPELLLPAMGATIIATAMTRVLVGVGPIYGQRAFGLQSYVELLSFAALGVAAAVAAAGFKRSCRRSRHGLIGILRHNRSGRCWVAPSSARS